MPFTKNLNTPPRPPLNDLSWYTSLPYSYHRAQMEDVGVRPKGSTLHFHRPTQACSPHQIKMQSSWYNPCCMPRDKSWLTSSPGMKVDLFAMACISWQTSKIQRHIRAPLEIFKVPHRHFDHFNEDLASAVIGFHSSSNYCELLYPIAGSIFPSRIQPPLHVLRQ